VAKSVESTYPACLYYEPGFATGTIYLYPVPSAAHTLILTSGKIITNISTIDTTISFPPGYEEALVYNLAVRPAPEYQKIVDREVLAVAIDSLASIKRMNTRESIMECDAGLVKQGDSFNINSGGYNN